MICALCFSEDVHVAARMPDSGNIVRDVYECNVCAALTPEYGISFALNTTDQINFHEKYWHDIDTGALEQELLDLTELVKFLGPHLGNPDVDRRILEIGSGRGGLLRALRDVGYAAHGCEPSIKLVTIAREHYGLSANVLENVDADTMLASADHDYDAVILWHIIEHLTDPLDIMRRVSSIVSPNGVIVLQVPLMRKDYIYPEHYFFCSHESLAYIAARVGFGLADVIYDEEHLFVTAVFRRSASPIVPAFLDYASIPDPLSQLLLLNERSRLAYSDMVQHQSIGSAAWKNLAEDRLVAMTAMEQLIKSGLEAIETQASMIDRRDLDIEALRQKLSKLHRQ